MRRQLPLFLLATAVCLLLADSSQGQFKRRRPGGFGGREGTPPGTQKVEVEVTPAKTVFVRVLELKPEFDKKGRPVQHTAESLKKLKGDSEAEQKLAGFKTFYTELKPGDVVHVTLATPKKGGSLTRSGQLTGTLKGISANNFTVEILLPAAQAQGRDKIVLKPEERQASLIIIQKRGEGEQPRRRPRDKR